MKVQLNTLFFSFVIFGSTLSQAKVALIYKGPGSCAEDCSESPARIATQMGYEVKFVGPKNEDPTLFLDASVWIQPGGLVRDQYKVMSQKLRQNIIKFVNGGGGYVGFCAGAFLASESYSWKSKRDGVFVEYGLNFFPGKSTIYNSGKDPSGKEIVAAIYTSAFSDRSSRQLYWEEGPVFFPTRAWKNTVEVVGLYPNKQVSAMRRTYGKGRVFVTAFHPEAPQFWRDYYHLNDSDGLDFDVVESMIRWASKP
jgi:glutamine amidotransferase-like uncharacterized protein